MGGRSVNERPKPGKVVTFYSFKGGVGRTMALANVAWRLANRHGLNVIAVDFDLEAPGLHHFFGVDEVQRSGSRGVADFIAEWSQRVEAHDTSGPDCTGWLLPIADDRRPAAGSVRLLTAGGAR